jgi:glycine/D-amino acid oxidase-like deaminating enzyme
MRRPDALVIGAGAIGASVAHHLAKRGMSVHVVEAAGIASGATGASEGLVGSIAKRKSGPVTDIVVKSFAMFPDLVDELGSSIEFCRKPGLMVVMDENHVALLKRFAEKRRSEGLRIEWLDRHQALEMEPLLSPRIAGALITPDQGAVNPMQLAFGYLRAARSNRAEITSPARVIELKRQGDTIVEVVTTSGSYCPGLVINAAGAAAEQVAALCGTQLEITPKRAQMIVGEALPSGTLRNTIYAGANVVAGLDPVSLEFEDMPADEERRRAELENPWQLSSFTQTANGNVLFCGGFGFVGATCSVDPVTIATMMRNIAVIIPSFASLRILRGWAGLEPCTPSNLPAIGFAPDMANFVLAAGHGNAGVMMSPFTGQMVADAILQSPIGVAAAPTSVQ